MFAPAPPFPVTQHHLGYSSPSATLPCLSDWPLTASFELRSVNYFINYPIMSEHTLQPDQVNLLFRHLG